MSSGLWSTSRSGSSTREGGRLVRAILAKIKRCHENADRTLDDHLRSLSNEELLELIRAVNEDLRGTYAGLTREQAAAELRDEMSPADLEGLLDELFEGRDSL